MACTVMACIVMACIVMARDGAVHIGRRRERAAEVVSELVVPVAEQRCRSRRIAYTVIAYIVMAYIVMACIVMAYTVMA